MTITQIQLARDDTSSPGPIYGYPSSPVGVDNGQWRGPGAGGSAALGRIKLSVCDITDGFENAGVDKSKKKHMDD